MTSLYYRVSGHSSFTNVDRDGESLGCAGNHLLNRILDQRDLEVAQGPDEV